jgi:GNAT superfamily N-acetyltransferase
MSQVEIRLYRREDRDGVRLIAFQTGYMGEPIDWYWRDQQTFADLITSYYTDREPESLFVAELDGTVMGYLTGCVDSRRAMGSATREIRRMIRRGAFFRPAIASFFWHSIFDLVQDRGVPDEMLIDPRWPAHLHIDLLPEIRGRGVGRRLMNRWFGRLRELGSPGVHLGTFAENRRAIAFFETCGLTRLGDAVAAPGFRTREGERMHAQWMVRTLG